MASYKDVALLNGSLDALSESLIKEKMLNQQQQFQQGELGVRRDVGLASANARTAATAERARHNQAVESNTANAQDEKRKENAQQMWGDTVKMYGTWVDKGIMAPDQAQSILQQSYAKMPDQAKAYIADHPSVQALQTGEPLFQTADKGAGFQTQATHNKDAWEKEYQKAQALEDQAKSENDLTSTQRQVMLEQAQKIRSDADTFFKPKQPASADDRATVTVTSKPAGDQGETVSERLTPQQYQTRQASTVAQKKAARANAISKQNPKLSRQQIMQQVEQEFSGK